MYCSSIMRVLRPTHLIRYCGQIFTFFCKPFACCFYAVVVWVLAVCHQGLFLWCNLGSDLLMLGRPGRMTLRRTPIRL
jgi:hypothetical protein